LKFNTQEKQTNKHKNKQTKPEHKRTHVHTRGCAFKVVFSLRRNVTSAHGQRGPEMGHTLSRFRRGNFLYEGCCKHCRTRKDRAQGMPTLAGTKEKNSMSELSQSKESKTKQSDVTSAHGQRGPEMDHTLSRFRRVNLLYEECCKHCRTRKDRAQGMPTLAEMNARKRAQLIHIIATDRPVKLHKAKWEVGVHMRVCQSMLIQPRGHIVQMVHDNGCTERTRTSSE
jgi:hypothetical protein